MITVVIPVYNQRQLTLDCIDSVLSARVEQNYQIVVVNDCSTDRKLQKALENLNRNPRVRTISNSENLGFTKSANRGMSLAADDSHPLLLNSDTIVYDFWLDALNDCLMSGPNVATVTPLTNQKGSHISCYPHNLWNDIDYPELDGRVLAELAYRHCRRAAVDVHTGVGFCMLINREAIKSVGLFDEVNFPRGYGEESDFCYRTRKVGWRHLVCGGTFVTHLHAQSFGAEKTRLRNEMLSTFQRLHPAQPAIDAAFREADPVKVVRRQLDLARLSSALNFHQPSQAISVYKAGEASSDPIYLEMVSGNAVFRVKGSKVGLPNIGSYFLPLHFIRLLVDLKRVNVSALRFVGESQLAEDCAAFARNLESNILIEKLGADTKLTW